MIRMMVSTLFALAAYGQPSTAPYTWTPVDPALTQPRADACAAALPDGSAIVAGGITANGDAISSVDLFQPGQGFTSAAAMNNARAGHSCTALAEIYDPGAQTWTIVADLTDPRWGHVAILLDNGRVLIVGGQDANGPKDTLELFEPKASAFVAVTVRLSSPRTNLAAALLPGGTVVITGGQNRSGASSAVDLYVSGKNTIIAGAPLLTARASHSANTLPDGTVLVAGGWDVHADFDSVEIYDIHKGSALSLGKLATARHGHFALTLPGNGNVLLGAGVGGGTVLASCEVYQPDFGAFSVIGPLASPRARTTVVPVADGFVLSAGGVSADGVTPISSTGVLPAPTLTWNLLGSAGPYAGDLAIHGRNFPAVTPTFSLTIKDNGGFSQPLDVIGATGGNFDVISNGLQTPGHSGLWILTAQTNGKTIATKEQPVVFANVALSSSCNPCAAGTNSSATGVLTGAAIVMLTAKVTDSEPSIFRASPSGSSGIQHREVHR